MTIYVTALIAESSIGSVGWTVSNAIIQLSIKLGTGTKELAKLLEKKEVTQVEKFKKIKESDDENQGLYNAIKHYQEKIYKAHKKSTQELVKTKFPQLNEETADFAKQLLHEMAQSKRQPFVICFTIDDKLLLPQTHYIYRCGSNGATQNPQHPTKSVLNKTLIVNEENPEFNSQVFFDMVAKILVERDFVPGGEKKLEEVSSFKKYKGYEIPIYRRMPMPEEDTAESGAEDKAKGKVKTKSEHTYEEGFGVYESGAGYEYRARPAPVLPSVKKTPLLKGIFPAAPDKNIVIDTKPVPVVPEKSVTGKAKVLKA